LNAARNHGCAKRKLNNTKQNKDKQNMKRKMRIITSASAASILAFAALAQETTNRAPGAAEYSDQTVAHGTRAERPGCAKKASDLIGMEVKNNQNEKLGKVDDLAVDVESGRIVYVILSTGGFIGIGDALHAVPPGALHHDVASKTLHLDADKAKLTAAPKFEMAKWAECCNSNQVAEVYSQYGQQPYCSSGHKKDASKTVTSRNTDGTWGKDRIAGENEASKSWAHLYMANCHLSSDWQFKQSVAVALPEVILKAGGLRGWAARFLPGRVAG
jgi:hypothetical protein